MTASLPSLQRRAASANPRTMLRIGWVLSGVVLLFLLFDAAAKLALMPQVIEATALLGYPAASIRPLGLICLACAVLYAVPRTAILGAILLTGFLGGATASHLRLDDPLFTHTLFGVYVGVLAWAGLYLRDPRLRSLIPFRHAD